MDTPSKDLLVMFESRLGPRLTSVLIWLIAIAVALTCLGGMALPSSVVSR